MLTRSIALALLATVMVGGAAVNRANAVVASPAAPAEIAGDETILNAAWVCGPSRCDWHPWLPGVHHEFARDWAVPRTPGCYREKRHGRWREVCPH